MTKLIAIAALALAACMSEVDAPAVEGDPEALTTCWNTSVAGLPGGFPPYDVMTTAVAMKQRAGGSWQACTCDSGPYNCTCMRLVGGGRAIAHWVGFTGSGQGWMSSGYYADQAHYDSNSPTYLETVITTDWDDDVYWHANTTPTPGVSGTIAVTLISGNNWQVHHCITQ